MNVKHKIIEKNTKWMKGLYVYIKAKGSPGRYFRYNRLLTIGQLKDFYKRKYDLNKTETLHQFKKKSKRYIRKKARVVKKYRKVPKKRVPGIKPVKGLPMSKVFRKGVNFARGRFTEGFNQSKIDKMYKEMMRPMLFNKKNLKDIATETHMKKMKKNIELNIIIRGNEGEKLLEINHIGKKTPRQAVLEIMRIMKPYKYIRAKYAKISEAFKNKQYQVEFNDREGFFKSMEVKSIIRI